MKSLNTEYDNCMHFSLNNFSVTDCHMIHQAKSQPYPIVLYELFLQTEYSHWGEQVNSPQFFWSVRTSFFGILTMMLCFQSLGTVSFSHTSLNRSASFSSWRVTQCFAFIKFLFSSYNFFICLTEARNSIIQLELF